MMTETEFNKFTVLSNISLMTSLLLPVNNKTPISSSIYFDPKKRILSWCRYINKNETWQNTMETTFGFQNVYFYIYTCYFQCIYTPFRSTGTCNCKVEKVERKKVITLYTSHLYWSPSWLRSIKTRPQGCFQASRRG